MDIKSYIRISIDTKTKILQDDSILSLINKITAAIIKAYKNDKKVLIAGNGGSAADAQHMAGEFVVKFLHERRGLSAFALTTDSSILTAAGNDYGAEKAFSRQIQANAKEGDVFIAISTSGNSKNIVLALEEAKKKGVTTIGLVGENKCKADEYCDYIIHVPSEITPVIQEAHLMIEHIICAQTEEALINNQIN